MRNSFKEEERLLISYVYFLFMQLLQCLSKVVSEITIIINNSNNNKH